MQFTKTLAMLGLENVHIRAAVCAVPLLDNVKFLGGCSGSVNQLYIDYGLNLTLLTILFTREYSQVSA
jgi:hypothetical protein